MTVYATRLQSNVDNAERIRLSETLGVAVAGPLEARSGLRNDGGGTVTVTTGTMDVVVSPLLGWVNGDSSPLQGGYPFVSDADRTFTLADGDPSNARIDLIVCRVYDAAYDGSGLTQASLEVLQGDPVAGTVPALPVSCIPLREVNIPAATSAGTGGLTSSNLGADRRRYTSGLGGVLPVVSAADRDSLNILPGQVVYRADTGNLELRGGTQWKTLRDDNYKPAWVPLAPGATYTARPSCFTPAYRLWPNGRVDLRGGFDKSSVISTGSLVTTLPSAARPSKDLQFRVAAQYGQGAVEGGFRLDVNASGAVNAIGANGGTWIVLDGIHYDKD